MLLVNLISVTFSTILFSNANARKDQSDRIKIGEFINAHELVSINNRKML